jgi:hypothetical protein
MIDSATFFFFLEMRLSSFHGALLLPIFPVEVLRDSWDYRRGESDREGRGGTREASPG